MSDETLAVSYAVAEMLADDDMRAEITNAIRDRADIVDMMRCMSATELADKMRVFANVLSEYGTSRGTTNE